MLQNGSCGLLAKSTILHQAKKKNRVECLPYPSNMVIFITMYLFLLISLQNVTSLSAKYLSVLKASFTLWTIWYLPGGRIIADKNRNIHGYGESHTYNLGNRHLKHHW